eukprot:jgi/Botrbrau1/4737/Bobra.0137s0009.1
MSPQRRWDDGNNIEVARACIENIEMMHSHVTAVLRVWLVSTLLRQGADAAGRVLPAETSTWRNTVLKGFDGAQISIPEDSGHYYNLFSTEDGTQVAAYVKSDRPGEPASLKGIGLVHKDVRVVVEPAYFGDESLSFIALVNGLMLHPSTSDTGMLESFVAKDGSAVQVLQGPSVGGVPSTITISTASVSMRVEVQRLPGPDNNGLVLALDLAILQDVKGDTKGLLSEGYGSRQSRKPSQGTQKLLAGSMLENYFEKSFKSEAEARRLPTRSKKLEVDEADPDMPLSFSWARSARLRGFFSRG